MKWHFRGDVLIKGQEMKTCMLSKLVQALNQGRWSFVPLRIAEALFEATPASHLT